MIVQFDIPGLDPNIPPPELEGIYIEKSAFANGFDCEIKIKGVPAIGNLRVASICVENLVLVVQEAARIAWNIRKTDAIYTDFEMTVTRGGNNEH